MDKTQYWHQGTLDTWNILSNMTKSHQAFKGLPMPLLTKNIRKNDESKKTEKI